MSANKFTSGVQVWRREGRCKIRHAKSYFRSLKRDKVANIHWILEHNPERERDLVVTLVENIGMAINAKPGSVVYCCQTNKNEKIAKQPHIYWRHGSRHDLVRSGWWIWNVCNIVESGYYLCTDEHVFRAERQEDYLSCRTLFYPIL